MRRIILPIVAILLLASPASAAPPDGDSATLSVVSIQLECEVDFAENRGCITFQTEPSARGGPHRHVIVVAIFGPGAISPNHTGICELDKDGSCTFAYRNRAGYTERFEAYVAVEADHATPISPIIGGSLPTFL